MGPVAFLRSIYDVGNLDTRFTTPSTVSYKTLNDEQKERNPNGSHILKPDPRAQPSNWRTPEFYFYVLFVLGIVPYMFWVAYDVSRPSDPRYHKFEEHLSPGWIPGRKIDNSDAQYHTFRENIPYLALLLALHPLLRRAWNAVYPVNQSNGSRQTDLADARLDQRASFDYAFALIFLVALHGISSLKVLLILYTNYKLAVGLPQSYVPTATWIFNICILFANELCSGYKLKSIAALVSTLQSDSISAREGFLVEWASWLDSWDGIMPRWEILFNITILRLISFNLDYYWSLGQRSMSPIEKKQMDPANPSERERVNVPAQGKDYNFRNYLAYAVYAPLYLTGPILTFNDYISQLRYKPASIEGPRTLRYAVRFLLALLAMEIILHYDYVGAISKASPVWASYTPAQLSLLSFFNLHIIWLKLLLPWRFARLWALLDGVDPPENMLRCVSDNYSTLQFWRAWHRSYNRWLIRYIFIPLGGANFRTWTSGARSIVTYLAIFTFVAMWHDIQLRLLIWGRKWENRPKAYRLLCGVGAVGNILMMITANLVGFAVGVDGLESIIRGVLHEWSGLLFFMTACSALFIGSQVMFEIRQSELRRGISLKC